MAKKHSGSTPAASTKTTEKNRVPARMGDKTGDKRLAGTEPAEGGSEADAYSEIVSRIGAAADEQHRRNVMAALGIEPPAATANPEASWAGTKSSPLEDIEAMVGHVLESRGKFPRRYVWGVSHPGAFEDLRPDLDAFLAEHGWFDIESSTVRVHAYQDDTLEADTWVARWTDGTATTHRKGVRGPTP